VYFLVWQKNSGNMRIVLFLIFFSALLGAQPLEKFHTTFSGSGIEIGFGVQQTLDKGYIVVGSTTSSGYGNTDIYLIKIDSMGIFKWAKTLGGFNNDVGK